LRLERDSPGSVLRGIASGITSSQQESGLQGKRTTCTAHRTKRRRLREKEQKKREKREKRKGDRRGGRG